MPRGDRGAGVLIPKPRGPLSAEVFARMQSDATLEGLDGLSWVCAEDEQILLWVAYELHYRGLEDVSDRWEWNPGLLAVRRLLEGSFEERLTGRVHAPDAGDDPVGTLTEMIAGHQGP